MFTNHESRITNHESRITHHESRSQSICIEFIASESCGSQYSYSPGDAPCRDDVKLPLTLE